MGIFMAMAWEARSGGLASSAISRQHEDVVVEKDGDGNCHLMAWEARHLRLV